MQSNQYSDRAQEEREFMKSWLVFLPEIKQEIQSFLELPQNKKMPPHLQESLLFGEQLPLLGLTKNRKNFSRLQESLSLLDKLPDIQDILEETDRKKLTSIFREFEDAKYIARLAILAIRINVEFGLEDCGHYVIPDSTQYKLGEFSVIHMWTVNVLPFAYVPARIVVSFEDSRYRVAFGVCLSPKSISSSVIQITLSPDWVDPLEASLRQLNLLQKNNQLSLDGIEYEFSSISETSKGAIWFGNPFTSPFIEMERAFFSVAEMVVTEKGQDAERNYLNKWHGYLVRQNSN